MASACVGDTERVWRAQAVACVRCGVAYVTFSCVCVCVYMCLRVHDNRTYMLG